MTRRRRGIRVLVASVSAVIALLGLFAAIVAVLNVRGEAPVRPREAGSVGPIDPALIVRGEYLSRIGDCAACHTKRGGPFFAGGRAIETPFGSVYSSNLTPDVQTGLGSWSA
ncbi:MAG TPA: cytochrome c, partial [Caldimonas sp.]|nr:cytochrome c [Caldimonas sp.]